MRSDNCCCEGRQALLGWMDGWIDGFAVQLGQAGAGCGLCETMHHECVPACLPAAQVWARYRVNQVKLMRALAWTAVSLVLFTIPSTVDPAGYW